MNPKILEKLITTPMPFGKYKGRFIYQLPAGYLEWFGREGFPSGELGMLLSTINEIKQNGLEELLKPLINRLHGKSNFSE
ncbi:MAG: hypothetical protein DWQ05_06375 [Calditrichaeota bacterium]|nr:MAG: hypothetical protein DWQ05_06375 [Calditrichota bacterium]